MDNRGEGIFPDEVIIQILARLPVKPLFRCKTVCKLWCKLSFDKYFIQVYNEVSRKNPMILVEISDSSSVSKSSLICVDNLRGVSEFSLDFLNDRVKVRASCNGLLCCSSIPDKGVFYVCNPVTREFRLLPKSRERPVTRFYPDGEATLVGLACDPMYQKFNVVLAGCHRTFGHRPDGSFICLVFDSELNKWRKFISFQDDHFTHMNKNQVVYVNNALHWLTVSLRCIRGMVPGIFPISQTGEYVFLATHKQVLVYHRKTQVWKEMYSVKYSSTLPLWFSAHAYRSTMFSCN
ncbi:hypothetical protein PIB30_053129 [Stylosanthes scabra]|uniref:F-box domain-containing protein n=1 Tax=Stylosanthes scabra TaxID=79078 RepID=A0ABU6YHN1_9FABA|nr:hypothetical protein [Stylosanthes scabra]